MGCANLLPLSEDSGACPRKVGWAWFLLPLTNLFRDPRSGLAEVLMLGFLLELSRFPHELPGARIVRGSSPSASMTGSKW
jgi:hypothetical protein